MNISGLNGDFIKVNPNPFQKPEASKPSTSFANVLQGYLGKVDATVRQSSDMAVKAATGSIDNVQDLTIAAQKAKLSLELTVTVRDKAVESYQEIMRMQI